MKQLIVNFDDNAPMFEIRVDMAAYGGPCGLLVNPEEVNSHVVMFDIHRDGTIRDHKLTPGEFASRMGELAERYKDDDELCHVYMDELMCKVLREHGFDKGVDVFDESPKWYA